jgi:hypothetical protein
MTHITVPDQTPFLEVVVTVSQTAFPFVFTFFDKTDLRVTVGSRELAQSAFTVDGTPGFEGGYPGGTLNLNVAVTDTVVRIWSELPPVRVNDFLEGAGFPSRAVNTELDRLTARQRDMRLRLQRTPVLAYAGSSKALAASDAGQLFTNDGQSAAFTYTLPAASAGLKFAFAVNAAEDLIVAAQSGDAIDGAASITGSALGCYVEVMALNDTTWVKRTVNGTWS